MKTISAIEAKIGQYGARIAMEKCSFEKNPAGLKTAEQALLNVVFPAKDDTAAIEEATKNLPDAAADTAPAGTPKQDASAGGRFSTRSSGSTYR
ncbi:MAG: hypothetical protein IJJ99_04320 [Oscillospiraceae bacterium]|nr:hypothetical protein [Oscillospiraceae bacterium]